MCYLYFSVWFYLVWKSLGPSMLLPMAMLHPFCGWVTSHCVYKPHHPFIWQYFILSMAEWHPTVYIPHYPCICRWTRRSLPFLGCCEEYCYEHWDPCIFSNECFPLFQAYAQEWDCRILGSSTFSFSGPSILFSAVAVPVHIPTVSVGGFSPHLSSSYYL